MEKLEFVQLFAFFLPTEKKIFGRCRFEMERGQLLKDTQMFKHLISIEIYEPFQLNT